MQELSSHVMVVAVPETKITQPDTSSLMRVTRHGELEAEKLAAKRGGHQEHPSAKDSQIHS
jgi:hypothetical protein